MGSGSTRRPSDIAAPKPIARKGSGGGGTNKSNSREECPIVWSVKLPTGSQFGEGQKLILKPDGDVVGIFAGLVKVTTITTKQGRQLNECLKKGFGYSGSSSKGYARFKRTTNTAS